MNAPRRSRPIGTRLFSLIGLSMIVPALVFAWAGVAASRELEERTRARDLLLASVAAERVSAVLATGLAAVNTVATQERWAAHAELPPGDLAPRRADPPPHDVARVELSPNDAAPDADPRALAPGGADSNPDVLAPGGADSLPVLAPGGADSLPGVVAPGGADSLPAVVARGGADSLPDVLAPGGADSLPAVVARGGADSLPDVVARGGADSLPDVVGSAGLEPERLARLRDAVRRAHVRHHALFDAFFAFDGAGRLVAGDTEGWQVDGPAIVAEGRRLGRAGFATARALSMETPGVVVLVPLVDTRGVVQLVVGARLAADSPRLARLLTDAALEPGQRVALHDLVGHRVAGAISRRASSADSSGGAPSADSSRGASSTEAHAPDDDPEVQHALSARTPTAGACRLCSGGQGATWAVAPVGPAHWAVLVWQPFSQAHAFSRQLARDVGLATVSMFLLAGLFAWGATLSVTRPLQFLTRAAGQMARGDLDAEIGQLPGDEVGALGEALEAMRVSVREARARVVQLNAGLEARVDERTRELRDLNSALAAREAERTGLLRRVISAQEDERKRIARELHDETSQQLAALSMGLDAAAVTAPDATRPALTRLRELAASTIAEVHRLILDLRPAVLDDLGLASAIEWCAERTLRSRGVVVRCEFSGLEQRLSWELETAVFRAAQEALNNVARHAHAEAVLVQVQLRNGRLNLEIEDDGQGFDPASVPTPLSTGRGLGLMGMRERVEAFGGKLNIDSAVGEGTRIRLEIRLNKERRHE